MATFFLFQPVRNLDWNRLLQAYFSGDPCPHKKKPYFHRGHYSFGPLYFPFKLTSLCRFGTEQHQRPGLDEYIVKANARFLHRKLTPFFFLVDLVPSKARIKKEKKSQVTLKLCVCVGGTPSHRTYSTVPFACKWAGTCSLMKKLTVRCCGLFCCVTPLSLSRAGFEAF